MESAFPVIFAVQVVGMIALAVGILYFIQRSTMKKLEPLKMELGGEIKGSLIKGSGLHFYNGNSEVTLKLLPGGKNTPPYLTLEQPAMLPFKSMVIMPENIATKALEKIGLLKDLKTGDPEFDRKYNINGKLQMEISNYLMSQNKKETIDRLHDAGFTMFQYGASSVTIKKPSYTQNDLNADAIRNYATELSKLATM